MNILLVSPSTPNTFWSFAHLLPLVGKKAAFPPLGLLTIGAMLPRSWSLKLVDLNVTELSDADLGWADAVFLSAMIVQEESVRRVISRSNAIGTPIVGGGPLFTTGAERFGQLACCVIGEAEDIMPSLIEDMERGTLKSRYQAPVRPDITKTPIPRWDLIDVQDYLTMSVQASRGCPFDCEFCDITAVYGRTPRVKTADQMIAELDAVLATGWKGAIFVVDDNFIGNRAKTKPILRSMIQWQARRRRPVTFITEASMNLVDDPELLDLMARANFKSVFIGIESPQEESLQECSKVQNIHRDLVAAVRRIHRAGIEVMAGFIVGFDSDTPRIFEQQRKFIQTSGITTAMVGMLNALPGTRLFNRLTAEGRIIGTTTGNNVDAALNFIPKLDRAVLTEGYRKLVKEIYTPRQYYERVTTFLRDYRPTDAHSRILLSDIRAFLASLWVLGVATPGRREFWKFFVRSLVFHRKAMATAVELAIRGYHFRTVAEKL